MRSASIHRLWAFGVAVAAVVVPIARASAADPSPLPSPSPVADAVAALTPGELATIRRLHPGWDRLPAAERQRIAVVVLKWRSLTPEQRERILHRTRAAERAGPVATESLLANLPRFERMSRDDRAEHARAHVAARAIAAAVVETLPPERRAIAGPEGGLTFAERAQLAGAIGTAWRRRVIESLATSPDVTLDVAEGMPESASRDFRALRDEIRSAGGAAAPEPRRRAYANRVLEVAIFKAKQGLARMGLESGDAEGHLVVVGRRLKDAFPDAFAGVAKEVAAAAEKGRDGLSQWARALESNDAARGPRQRPIWDFVLDLERRRPSYADEVLTRLDELQAALLAMLRVPPEKIATLRATVASMQRKQMLLELLEQHGPIAGGRGQPARPPRGPAMDDKPR